ncbi:MAG TPA: hypothetical protein VKZ53_19925 [Candidatus Angelobacter sp.]|nr:hypothetical protein [Candidatus Angelobacter sp.]
MKQIHVLRGSLTAMDRLAALDKGTDPEFSHLIGDILANHDPLLEEAATDALAYFENEEIVLSNHSVARGEKVN